MNNEPANSGTEAIHQRIMTGVKAHRLKVRILTSAAFVFGFLAMVSSLVLAWSYPVFILPKQREMEFHAVNLLEQARTNAITTMPVDAGQELAKLLAIEIQVTNITTAGTALIAAAVGLLGLGTLILLTVVILNRRVALNQVNTSLAEISGTLRGMQDRGSNR